VKWVCSVFGTARLGDKRAGHAASPSTAHGHPPCTVQVRPLPSAYNSSSTYRVL
jgi:hypothetical protein